MMDADRNGLAQASAGMTDQQKVILSDAMNRGDPLDRAVELARSTRRVEAFDAHRNGFHSSTADQDREKPYLAYEKRLTDAWRNPAPVLDTQADPHGLKKQEASMLNANVAAAFSGPEPTRDELDSKRIRGSKCAN